MVIDTLVLACLRGAWVLWELVHEAVVSHLLLAVGMRSGSLLDLLVQVIGLEPRQFKHYFPYDFRLNRIRFTNQRVDLLISLLSQ